MGGALPKIGVPSSAEAYDAALEGLVRLNQTIMGQQEIPPLYQAGVKYSNRPNDVWRHADDVARDKWADCEGLSAYRAAELRTSGEDPDAAVATYKTGPRRYHAVVRRGTGLIEDPSKALGMRIPDEDRYEAKLGAAFGPENVVSTRRPIPAMVIGEDPAPANRTVSFDVYAIGPGRFTGVVRIPLDVPLSPAQALFMQTSPSPTAEAAAAKTSNAASLVAQLSPDLAKVIPPAAAAALATVSDPKVKEALKSGDLHKVYDALPASVKDKIPAQVRQGIELLKNPALESFLKSDNPAIRAANLLNLTTLARPDIYASNVVKTAEGVADKAKSAFNALKSLF